MTETPEQRKIRMRALGIKGGEAVKAKYAAEGRPYSTIARMGGLATKGIKKGSRAKPAPGIVPQGARIVTESLDAILAALNA